MTIKRHTASKVNSSFAIVFTLNVSQTKHNGGKYIS